MENNVMKNANQALSKAFINQKGNFIETADIASLSESEFRNFKILIANMRDCLYKIVGSTDYDDIEEYIQNIINQD